MYVTTAVAHVGEEHPHHKLTEALVREIRSLALTMRDCDIADRFHLTRQLVGRVINRQLWSHVSD